MTENIEIRLPSNGKLKLISRKGSPIKKAVIEEFLPRFAKGATLLNVRDTIKKAAYVDDEQLRDLNFSMDYYDELPDIIAYDKSKNWIYLIEAVHSAGPMTEMRVFELKKMLKKCKAKLIFITAFISSTEFRKWILDIAWETEVWTADNPEHMVHFNGDKFFGPYK